MTRDQFGNCELPCGKVVPEIIGCDDVCSDKEMEECKYLKELEDDE